LLVHFLVVRPSQGAHGRRTPTSRPIKLYTSVLYERGTMRSPTLLGPPTALTGPSCLPESYILNGGDQEKKKKIKEQYHSLELCQRLCLSRSTRQQLEDVKNVSGARGSFSSDSCFPGWGCLSLVALQGWQQAFAPSVLPQ